jgi:hypothetical protein
MRVRSTLMGLALALPGAAAAGEPAPAMATANAAKPDCPRTTSYHAEQIGSYRGQRLAPQKLDQLPPATGYMAVYRRIDGCEAPLTAVEYRGGGRR